MSAKILQEKIYILKSSKVSSRMQLLEQRIVKKCVPIRLLELVGVFKSLIASNGFEKNNFNFFSVKVDFFLF